MLNLMTINSKYITSEISNIIKTIKMCSNCSSGDGGSSSSSNGGGSSSSSSSSSTS